MNRFTDIAGYIVCLLIWACAASGCAGMGPGKEDAIRGQGCRCLLYDNYAKYLIGKEASLKDAFVFSAMMQERVIAITFDDGPSEHTEKIISILKELDCPAAFFLIARNVGFHAASQYSDPLFETGVHGYEHEDFTSYNSERCFADTLNAKVVFEMYGMKPEYFRPPYGTFNDSLASAVQKNGLKGILWSLDSLDWEGVTGKSLYERVVLNARNGDIILFHETHSTADEVEQIVIGLRDMGFRMVSIDSLLKYPKCPSPGEK